MLLRLGHAWAQARDLTPTELSWLTEFLTFTSSNFRGEEDAEPLLGKEGHFPAGLASLVARTARERGLSVDLVQRAVPDVWQPCATQESTLDGLWEHQKAAVRLIVSGARRGVVQHGTGTGKGTTISILASLLTCKVLIIVPSIQLLSEMIERLAKFGVRAGRLGGGYNDGRKQVLVCVAASLKKLTNEQLESFGAVIVDECHGAASQSQLHPLMKMLNASVRLGFSGTPMSRADKRSLFIVGAIGEVIHKFSPAEAAQEEIIAVCRLRMAPFQHSFLPTTGRYDQWERQAYAENVKRNELLLSIVRRTPAPRILFVRTKLHQKILATALGEDCMIVNDTFPPDELRRRIKKLERGDYSTLISTPIFRQGVDIPSIQTVIQGSGGKAEIDLIQKVGRGSRRFQKDGSEKTEFSVYDVDDRGCGQCGGNHRGCRWLEEHAAERAAAYKKFGYRIIPSLVL